MDLNRSIEKPPLYGKPKPRRRERYFELVLSAAVKGTNTDGKEFTERTKISSISAQEASFRLTNRVTTGSKLNLCLDVPRTLILESHLVLSVSGDVIYIQNDIQNGKKQLVMLRLDKSFKIQKNS